MRAACWRKIGTNTRRPFSVIETVRTRRSFSLSTRLTNPFLYSRSTATLTDPGLRSTFGPRADQFLDVPHFGAKYAIEEAIRVGGMPYTILRLGYFAQKERWLKAVLTGPGVYTIPAGNQGLAVVDVRDIAEAAAISLAEEGHKGKTYDLVSSEMLSGPAAAAHGRSCWAKKSLTPDTDTSMALRHKCGRRGVRVGWPTIFGSCSRVASSVDSATRRTRRRALPRCLGTSRERTAASLKN